MAESSKRRGRTEDDTPKQTKRARADAPLTSGVEEETAAAGRAKAEFDELYNVERAEAEEAGEDLRLADGTAAALDAGLDTESEEGIRAFIDKIWKALIEGLSEDEAS